MLAGQVHVNHDLLSQVVQVAVRGALQSSGQNCAGAERFYVHRDIYPTFVTQIVKLIKSISVVSNFNPF